MKFPKLSHEDRTPSLTTILFRCFTVPIIIIVGFVYGWNYAEKEAVKHDRQVLACKAPASFGNTYADPLTATCGHRDGRLIYPGTKEACYQVLKDPDYQSVLHCWEKILK